jgi:hypothetical protein
MDSSEILPEAVQPSIKPDAQSFNTETTDPIPRKPGSKAQGRKRTKTGCLSKPRNLDPY